MKRLLLSFALAALCAAPALAQKIDGPPVEGEVINCDKTGYKSESYTYPALAAIPDNLPAGLTTPPIVLGDDGSTIQDVLIDINAFHTWVGDLIATVYYDLDCDGTPEASAKVLCRPRGTSASTPVPCGTSTGVFGCSGNLGTGTATAPVPALYTFTDGIGVELAVGACAANIAPGCYRPPVVGGTPLAAFNGMRKGGCWTLNISDNAAADTGFLAGWAVYVLNNATATVPTTWGSVKTMYR